MESIINLCSNFFSKYNEFMNKMNISPHYDEKLRNIEFEIRDDLEKIYYDYDNNKILISRKFMEDEQFEFYFYRTLLDVLTTKKEGKIVYSGLSYSNENNSKNIMFNDMISNYICNSITGIDIDDIKRVFIPKLEKIITSEEIVKMYFNNDIIKLVSYFEELGIDFNQLSKNMDMLYNNGSDIENKNNSMGTIIDRMLIDAIINKYAQEKKDIIDYSSIEITNGLVLGHNGFDNISNNKLYYYNGLKNAVTLLLRH